MLTFIVTAFNFRWVSTRTCSLMEPIISLKMFTNSNIKTFIDDTPCRKKSQLMCHAVRRDRLCVFTYYSKRSNAFSSKQSLREETWLGGVNLKSYKNAVTVDPWSSITMTCHLLQLFAPWRTTHDRRAWRWQYIIIIIIIISSNHDVEFAAPNRVSTTSWQ